MCPGSASITSKVMNPLGYPLTLGLKTAVTYALGRFNAMATCNGRIRKLFDANTGIS
jgi:hypothetical protein